MLALVGWSAAGAHAASPTLTNMDVGFPSLPGSTTATNINGRPGYVVVVGGDDIWNTADNFHFAYRPATNDFDYVVRVHSLEGPDTWTKAELMARESMDDGTRTLTPLGGDRHNGNMTTRSGRQNQVAMQGRHTRDGGSAWPPDIGLSQPLVRPSYPNTWLRLRREGSVFSWRYQ